MIDDKTFDPTFANNNADKRQPTVAELADGFACGELDIDLFNGLFAKIYEAFKDIYSKQESIITDYTGFTADRNNASQFKQAIDMAVKSAHYIDTGTENAVVLSRSANNANLEVLFDGSMFFFTPANANTGAATLKLKALTAKPMQFRGAALTSGYLNVNHVYMAIYDQTADVFHVRNTTIESIDFTLPSQPSFVAVNLTGSKIYMAGSNAGSENDFIEFDEATNEYRFWENKTANGHTEAKYGGAIIVGQGMRAQYFQGDRIDLDLDDESTDISRNVADFRMHSTNQDNISGTRTKIGGYFEADVYTPANGDRLVTAEYFYIDGSRSYATVRGGSGDFRDAYGARAYATTDANFAGEGSALTGGLAIASCNNDTQINLVRGQVVGCTLNAASTHNDVYGSYVYVNPNDAATGSSADVYGEVHDMNDDSSGNFTVTGNVACLYQLYSGTWNTAGDKYGIYQASGIENNRFIGGIELDGNPVAVEQEGTWTPNITTSAGGTVPILDPARLEWHRVGDDVRLNFAIKLGVLSGASGFLRMSLPFTAKSLEMVGGRWLNLSNTFANIAAVDAFLESGANIGASSGEHMVSGGSLYFNQGNAWNYLAESLSQARSANANAWLIGSLTYRAL